MNTKMLMENFLLNYRDELEQQLKVAMASSNEGLRNGFVLKTNHPADREYCPDILHVNIVRVSHLNDLIRKTDTALERVRNGTYGKCRCGKRIPARRLEAVPFTDY